MNTIWAFACMRTGKFFQVSAEDAAWFHSLGVVVRLMDQQELEAQ